MVVRLIGSGLAWNTVLSSFSERRCACSIFLRKVMSVIVTMLAGAPFQMTREA